ncbi:MAG: hypothetical protein JWM11_7503 [Planctomycetaceae bacterium]|nr:hypothetical protein [Planctomycetaceae bacterium]
MHELTGVVVIVLGLIGFAPPDPEPIDEISVFESVKRLDSDAQREEAKRNSRFNSGFNINETSNEFEAGLQKLTKLGRKAEKYLTYKLKRDAAKLVEAQKRLAKLDSDDDGYSQEFVNVRNLSNNLELLTTLRRIQRQPDPLLVSVKVPEGLTGTTRELPSLAITLESTDVEKTPVWMGLLPHFYGSAPISHWRVEVKTPAGDLLPTRHNSAAMFNFLESSRSDGWLKFGEALNTTLKLNDLIEISKPGEYTVTILYHPKNYISKVQNTDDLEELICFRSQSFKLTVRQSDKRIIVLTNSDRAQVTSSISELPKSGIVKFVIGVYDNDDYGFISRDSPAGKILIMNWKAVPALLDALSDKTLSVHQRAWILTLLYTITSERDLDPILIEGSLPDYEGRRGNSARGISNESQIIPIKQQLMIAKWLTFRDECLDIRETSAE